MYKRSVFATSADGGETWTAPVTLFENFTAMGRKRALDTARGPQYWTGRKGCIRSLALWTQGSTWKESIRDAKGWTWQPLGQFWLNETVLRTSSINFPTYLEMDPVTRRDAMQLLASLIHTTVKYPDLQGGQAVEKWSTTKDLCTKFPARDKW